MTLRLWLEDRVFAHAGKDLCSAVNVYGLMIMNSSDIVQRSAQPSAEQLESLVQFLEANQDIARGFSTNICARTKAKAKWERLAVRLNSIKGTTKTTQKWIKYWADKKSLTKKKATARNAARLKTGHDVVEPELSEIEERIVALIKGGSASGDRHLQNKVKDEDSTVEEVGGGVEHNPLSPDPCPELQDWSNPEPCAESPPSCRSLSVSPAQSPPRTSANELLSPGHSTTSRASHHTSAATPYRLRRLRTLQVVDHEGESFQWRSQLLNITEKVLRLEEKRLALDQRLVTALERSLDRERLMARANIALGEGLKALAEAINNRR